MDPSLAKEKEAFKKRAIAASEKAKKIREAAAAAAAKVKPQVEHASKPPKPKKKVHTSQAESSTRSEQTLEEIKEAAKHAHRTSNPHRVLKCIMDMLKTKYISKEEDDQMTFEEILTTIDLVDIRYDMRQWLRDALTSNTKVKFYSDEDKFVFKPALGHQVRTRKQLLARLQSYDMEGLGGITMTDICEAIPKADKTIKRLMEEQRVMCITRQDKEQVIFFNNLEFSLGQSVSPEVQELWHQISVDSLTETDIDKYLADQGLSAMQGERRKRKAPSTQKKARKKFKPAKVLNTHLDNQLLKDYSAQTNPNTQ